MLKLHRPDGTIESDPSMEPFYTAIRRSAPEDWDGANGQAAIERNDRDGDRWLFLSPAGPGLLFLYAQLVDGRKAYTTGDDPEGDVEEELVIGGRHVPVQRRFFIPADEAASIARYFVEQDGLLYPAANWMLDGEPYWPEV